MARILVVDDDACTRNIIAKILERSGHSVLSCGSAEEALETLVQNVFDLVLLDYQLPEMSGIDLLGELPDITNAPPVIMLTASESLFVAVAFLREGGEDFLCKPIQPDLLKFSVNRALERASLRRERDAARAAHEAAQEANALIKAFLHKIVHELSTPCVIIRNALAIISSALDDGDMLEARDWLSRIQNNTNRLERLVRDMLDCASFERGTVELRKVCARVDAIAEAVVDEMRHLADAKRIALKLELGPVSACVDQDRLHQVFTNILSNALRHTPEEGTIVARVGLVDGRCECSVSDTGDGVPDELKPHVFKEFWQSEAGGQLSGALGLGLAIVRGIVVAHGGSIDVSDAEPHGAVFTLRIPIS